MRSCCLRAPAEKPAKKTNYTPFNTNEPLTFFKLGNLGNPLRLVRPTLIRLSDSKLMNSSVRPTMLVLLQLSKIRSFICNKNKLPTTDFYYFLHKTGFPKISVYFDDARGRGIAAWNVIVERHASLPTTRI